MTTKPATTSAVHTVLRQGPGREAQDASALRFPLSDDIIDNIFKLAPLHDIGKVGIPDRILLKPSRFTPEEFEIMKTHTTVGRNAINQAEMQLAFLTLATEIAYCYQEKLDASEYPEGIGGDDIPISARLMAMADVCDALISRRAYKEGMPHEQAMRKSQGRRPCSKP